MTSCGVFSIPYKGRKDIFGSCHHIPIKLPSLIMLLSSIKKDPVH
jgi:hypothetical protein